MIQEILQAFVLIFIAEMGDKTQILAIAFATKYPVKKVLLGIMIGAFLNHGIAVTLGSQLTKLVPMDTIQIIAGIAFIIFGIWSLRLEEDEEEAKIANSKYGAVITVALAFFIGELGDKTQLTAITLAAGSTNFLFILLGTVSGMVATGGLGIFVGKKIGDKVPEIGIKIVSSLIFLFFGSAKLYRSVPNEYVSLFNSMLYLLTITIIFVVLLRKNYIAHRNGPVSRYRNMSKQLYDYYADMEVNIEKLCNGTEICGTCDGIKCPVGNTRAIINNGLSGNRNNIGDFDDNLLATRKFDKQNINEIIEATKTAKDMLDGQHRKNLDKILGNLELINTKE
jgi:putative Ca2+/H+ antiporter (TMEM165/GDT1 family)